MSKSAALTASMLGWIVLASGTGAAAFQDEKPAAEKKTKQAVKEKEKEKDAEKAPEPEKEKDKDALENLSGPEKELAAKGLTKHDKKFLLDETAAVDKLNQIKSLMMDKQKAITRYSSLMTFGEGIQEMEAQVQALQQRVNVAQSQLNSMGSGYGRARQFANQQQTPLKNQQAQDRAAIAQLNSQIAQTKAKGPKPDEFKAGTAEIERVNHAYVDGVMELDTLIAPLLAKYHELGKDKAVHDAIEALHKETKQTYKLGPSNDLVFASRIVLDMKRNMPRQMKSAPKSSPKKKSSTKSKGF